MKTDRNYYNLKKTDQVKIENVAEKLYQEKENLVGKIIDWETFTEKYLKLDLPYTELERIYWVSKRPTWIDIINKELIKFEYPCQLYVSPSRGVYLLINGSAISKTITKRTKKTTNVFETTIEILEGMKGSYPEAKKLIEIFINIYTDNLHAFYSRIANSKLQLPIRRELMKIIQKSLPPSEE